jgi:putative FmdB family regulatory protein
MPTYDYRCENCGHHLDAFQSITDAPLTTCPHCEANALRRLIGAGAGIIFKGSGFYETDYKRNRASSSGKRKPASEKPKKESTSDSSSKPKTD